MERKELGDLATWAAGGPCIFLIGGHPIVVSAFRVENDKDTWTVEGKLGTRNGIPYICRSQLAAGFLGVASQKRTKGLGDPPSRSPRVGQVIKFNWMAASPVFFHVVPRHKNNYLLKIPHHELNKIRNSKN